MIAVNVAQLLRAQVGTFRSFEFSETEPSLADDVRIDGPVRGEVKLTRTPRGVLADVRYVATLDQDCGRCLEPARAELASDVSEEYVATTNVVTGQPLGITIEADEQVISPNHELDLTDLIRQDMVVQQSLQPLCRDDCAGLCEQCGADLNIAACAHQSEHAAESDDAPLGRLGELLKAKLPASDLSRSSLSSEAEARS